jgi:hypothetical protein
MIAIRSPGTGRKGWPMALRTTNVASAATPNRIPRTVAVSKPSSARLRPKMIVSA